MTKNTDVATLDLFEPSLEEMLDKKIQSLSKWIDEVRRNLPLKERELFEARQMLSRYKKTEPTEKKRSGINWKEQVMSCINVAGHIVKTVDILKCVFGYEIPKSRRRSHIVMISITLNRLVAEGKIKEYKMPKTKGYLYGLPEWFEKGEPKDGRKWIE